MKTALLELKGVVMSVLHTQQLTEGSLLELGSKGQFCGVFL